VKKLTSGFVLGETIDPRDSNDILIAVDLSISVTNILSTIIPNSSFAAIVEVMKAIKGLAIHKKLASYRSAFPHNDRTEVRNATEIYDDVLEFSRLVLQDND
jgi:hypothetical protein